MNAFNASNAQFLANLNLMQARSDKASQQLSSGYRVSQVSDDPSSVADILSLSMEMARTSQAKTNLATVKSEVDTGESALNSAVLMVQNIVSLGTQGATDTATAATRTSLAQQVSNLMDQLVGISQTQVNGRYIFSGDTSGSAMYQRTAGTLTRQFTTANTRLVEDASGLTFGVSLTAQDIFDHRNPDDTVASDNVFNAVQALQTGLQNNNTTAITNALTALKTSADWLNRQQSFYGNAQARIDVATSTAESLSVRQQADMSTLRDADIAAQALEVTQAKTAITAAMSAQGIRQRSSLFDYLK